MTFLCYFSIVVQSLRVCTKGIYVNRRNKTKKKLKKPNKDGQRRYKCLILGRDKSFFAKEYSDLPKSYMKLVSSN